MPHAPSKKLAIVTVRPGITGRSADLRPSKCKYCGSDQHTSLQCFDKPRLPIKSHKALNWRGPVTAKWLEVRNQWLQDNPPPWHCFYCGELLTINTLTVDHKNSRSRRPDQRFDNTNLVASCAFDNKNKGSKSAEEYLKQLRQS